ncbi:MAG: polysaccharide biosynthesis/export family protein [Chryseolinea sp.]
MKNLRKLYPQLLLITLFLASCSSYKQNIMFQVPEGAVLEKQVQDAEKNYTIQKNDILQLEVYTNKGERLIDPDLELVKNEGGQNAATSRVVPSYLVDINGTVKFPMIGALKLEGLKLREAEEILQKEYGLYYQGSFVILKHINKRVIVLGAPGGQVIPLANENMRLVEVLALAKGIGNDGKAQNIRVLRDDKIFLTDLSTIDGYRENNMVMESGDIVYVEPVRRPFPEAVRDYGPIFSVMASLATLLVVIIGLQ